MKKDPNNITEQTKQVYEQVYEQLHKKALKDSGLDKPTTEKEECAEEMLYWYNRCIEEMQRVPVLEMMAALAVGVLLGLLLGIAL